MKELKYTSRFKKDLKRILNQPQKLKALQEVIDMLRNEVPLPKKYREHALRGDYAGCVECHIESDFLLIWFDEKSNVIALFRLGSHSELFKK